MLCFFLTPLIDSTIYRGDNRNSNAHNYRYVSFKGNHPCDAHPEGARRAEPNPGRIPSWPRCETRSPRCFSVGNARARYSHTEPSRAEPRRVVSRAFIIRALPPRGCRKHGRPCEKPGGKRGSSTDARFPMGLGRYTGYSYFAREASSRNTRRRKNGIRASEHSYLGQTCLYKSLRLFKNSAQKLPNFQKNFLNFFIYSS